MSDNETTWQNDVDYGSQNSHRATTGGLVDDNAKHQEQELPLVIQAIKLMIPSSGLDINNPANNTLKDYFIWAVNNTEFIGKTPNAEAINAEAINAEAIIEAIIEDGIIDTEEALTILSEASIAYNNHVPVAVDSETFSKIKEGLQQIGIELSDHSIQGLAYIETNTQAKADARAAMQFNGVADTSVEAIDLKIPEPDNSKPEPVINGLGMGQ